MQITVEVNSCDDCRHQSHSGAFTVRGARQTCSHSDALPAERVTKEEFLEEYPEYAERDFDEHFNYHWIHVVLTESSDAPVTGIPEWCPLKHNSRY